MYRSGLGTAPAAWTWTPYGSYRYDVWRPWLAFVIDVMLPSPSRWTLYPTPDVSGAGVPTPYSDDQIAVGGLNGYPAGEIRCTVTVDPLPRPGHCQSPFDIAAPERAGLAARRGFGSSPSQAAGHRMYEMRIPLRMVHVMPGDTIGIAVQSLFTGGIYDASGRTLAWPVETAGFTSVPTNNFASLTLGSGEYSPSGGEFWGGPLALGLAVTAVVIATLAMLLFVRRRRRRGPPPA